MSIEGTTASFELEPILAPVPVYTVTFKNYDGNILETQQVKKGSNAVMPTSPTRTGHDFTGWSSSGTNIRSDTVITAQYAKKTFDVVFFDNLKGTREVKAFNYGDTLSVPNLESTEAYNALGWDAAMNGITTVTENLVVTAEYNIKEFTVNFYDFEGNVIQTSKVAYGDGVEAPCLGVKLPYIFIEWNTGADLGYITENLDIHPLYKYDETVEAPVANIETGSFSTQQTVMLSCETEGAQIYYTTDGSNPLAEQEITLMSAKATPTINGTLYTGPFTLDSSATIVFAAVKDGMNSSACEEKLYAINTVSTSDIQHLVTIHYGIDDAEYQILVDDNSTIDLFDEMKDLYGYTLKGTYTDDAHTNAWNLASDKVTASMDIYLAWEKNTYTVKFLDKNNNLISEEQVAYQESAEAPAFPEVDGYIFSGWDADYTNIFADTTIKATYISEDNFTRVSLSKSSAYVKPNDTFELAATVNLGTNTTSSHIVWQSSDESIVSVDDNGNVTAIEDGEAMIFAVSEDSGDVAICEVLVSSACRHNYTSKLTAPTCTSDGYTTHTCSVCNDSYVSDTVPATGHTEVIRYASEPTCYGNGYSGDTYCSVCNTMLYTGSIIDAKEHIDADGDGYCDECTIEIERDNTGNCSCNCHKSGIMRFFFKIILLFQKIFGINRTCACGVAHY